MIFETSFRPYVLLYLLHFHHTLIELVFPSKCFNSISTAISSFRCYYLEDVLLLSKTLNIILISCILCQLLYDGHRQTSPVKYNLSKSHFH